MSEVRRLHISGLSPTQCSIQDLHSRFQSFQLQVRDVHNWPPGKNGVGEVQNWCFLTVEGEPSKIKRATDLLNNTIWKGSKLRIGTAKSEDFKASKEETILAAQPKKKKRRKLRGVESEKIDQPITAKDVEEGEWGWKKTPAGHLLRPLHMRPSHPLPRPTAGPVTPKEKDPKRKSKGATKKPMTRTRRVTIDPSRYGAIHLSGLMLDDGTEGFPVGAEWECEETEKGDVRWILKDSEGKVLKAEVVKLHKEVVKEVEFGSEADSENEEADFESESESESSMDEVAAAINNAATESSSESEEEGIKVKDWSNQSKQDSEAKVQSSIYPSYDPNEDSDFSEGYQEMQPDLRPQARDWKEEKEGHLNLLKNMFGEKVTSVDRSSLAPVKPWNDDDESDDADDARIEEAPEPLEFEITEMVDLAEKTISGAQKRAALLNSSNSSSNRPNSFQPIARYDPGASSEAQETQEDQEIEDTVDKGKLPRSTTPVNASLDIPPADQVQMSSLKDMFRPKEASAGFSLMDDLDLDLELEEEDEDEQMEMTQLPEVQNRWVPDPARIAPPTPFSAQEKLPFFFPSSVEDDDQSWLSILQKDQMVTMFCRDKSEEQLQAIWKERKGQLTQDYKRRHREALKKKKRKYTGSRAAGTSMPLRA